MFEGVGRVYHLFLFSLFITCCPLTKISTDKYSWQMIFLLISSEAHHDIEAILFVLFKASWDDILNV